MTILIADPIRKEPPEYFPLADFRRFFLECMDVFITQDKNVCNQICEPIR